MVIIDGLTGKPITNEIKSSVGIVSSPLSISMEDHGNDLYLFWLTDCLRHEGGDDEYGISSLAFFDTCSLRYKTRETTKLCITNSARKASCKTILKTGRLSFARVY